MILNTKRNFPAIAKNKCLQKFYLSSRKSDGHGRSITARQNWYPLVAVNELKIIIFVSLF